MKKLICTRYREFLEKDIENSREKIVEHGPGQYSKDGLIICFYRGIMILSVILNPFPDNPDMKFAFFYCCWVLSRCFNCFIHHILQISSLVHHHQNKLYCCVYKYRICLFIATLVDLHALVYTELHLLFCCPFTLHGQILLELVAASSCFHCPMWYC